LINNAGWATFGEVEWVCVWTHPRNPTLSALDPESQRKGCDHYQYTGKGACSNQVNLIAAKLFKAQPIERLFKLKNKGI